MALSYIVCVQSWNRGTVFVLTICFIIMHACMPDAQTYTHSLTSFQCATQYASLQLAGIIRPHDGNCYTPRLVGSEPDTRYTMWGVFVSKMLLYHHYQVQCFLVRICCWLHLHIYITWFLLLSGTINFTLDTGLPSPHGLFTVLKHPAKQHTWCVLKRPMQQHVECETTCTVCYSETTRTVCYKVNVK